VTASNRRPIQPTRIIPANAPLPAPAVPPPPPRPPAPPAVADADPLPDWWQSGSGPSGPPPPVPVDVHVTVHVDLGGDPDPEPDPPWWKRIRWGYHAAMCALALPVSGPWARVLDAVRHDEGLAAAWVMAAVVWALIAVWDNVVRIRARHADPDAWLPKLRAGLARLLLYAAILATTLTLPLTTAVYWITGVPSP
jgi:hypothetical protein